MAGTGSLVVLVLAVAGWNLVCCQQGHRERAIIRISEEAANKVADKHARSMTAKNFSLSALTIADNKDGLQYSIINVSLTSFEGIQSHTELHGNGNVSLNVSVSKMSMASNINADFHSIFRFDQRLPLDFFNVNIMGTLRFEVASGKLRVRLLQCLLDFEQGAVGNTADSLDLGLRHALAQIIQSVKAQFVSHPQMCEIMAGPLTAVISELVSPQGILLSSMSGGIAPPVSLVAVLVREDSMLIAYQVDKGSNSNDEALTEEELSPFTNVRDVQISLGEDFLNVILDTTAEPLLIDKDGKLQTLIRTMLKKEALKLIIPQLMQTFPADVDMTWSNHVANVTIHVMQEEARADVILAMELWAISKCQTIHVFTTTWDLEMGIVVKFNSSSLQIQAKGLGGQLKFSDSSVGEIKNAALVAIFQRIASMPDSILDPLNKDVPAISLASVLPSDMTFHRPAVEFKQGQLIYEADVGPMPSPDSREQEYGKGLEQTTMTVHDDPPLRKLSRQTCDIRDSAPSVHGCGLVVAMLCVLTCLLS